MGKIEPGEIFTDHMIVQRDLPVCIYGSAADGDVITVEMNGISKKTQTIHGEWKIYLPSVPVGGPYTICVSSGINEVIKIQNVLCGDVWLAGGQSNMEIPLSATDSLEITETCFDLSNVWIFDMPRRAYDKSDRMNEVDITNSKTPLWVSCTGEYAMTFSAVAYHFARTLSNGIDVPIGIIACKLGNTSIISWMPEHLLNKIPKFNRISDDYLELEKNMDMFEYDKNYFKFLNDTNEYILLEKQLGCPPADIPIPIPPYGPKSYRRPSGLYKTLLSKIISYNTTGIIWYQGESDAIDNNELEYKDALKCFIEFLRESSSNTNMLFLNVQLAPYGGGFVESDKWCKICQAQMDMISEIENYAMITIGDCGDINIHPTKKRKVGERLGYAALNLKYGRNIEYCGPVPISAYSIDRIVYIEFDHAKNGLVFKKEASAKFEIAGDDMVFYNAMIFVDNNIICLQSSDVPQPLFARYAWDIYPDIGLFNTSDLPASIFSMSIEKR